MTKKTFSSIVDPIDGMDDVLNQVNSIKGNLKDLIYRYLPSIRTVPLRQGLVFKPTWKSLPTYRLVTELLIKRMKQSEKRAKRVRSCFVAFPFELSSWVSLMTFVHSRGYQWSAEGGLQDGFYFEKKRGGKEKSS